MKTWLLREDLRKCNNQLTGAPLEVNCEIIDDSIIITSQKIEGNEISGYSFKDFLIHSPNGYLYSDSVFFNLSHSSTGNDPYHGICQGQENLKVH